MKRIASLSLGVWLFACGGGSSPDAGAPPIDAGGQQDSGPQVADSGPSCQNGCTSGESRCLGNAVESCELQANGCFDWSAASPCEQNQACTAGACVATVTSTDGGAPPPVDAGPRCDDACTAGGLRCVANAVESCDLQATGCLDWSAPVDCATGRTCDTVTGLCVSATDGGSAERDGGATGLDAGSTELDGGATGLDAGSTELDAGSTELDAGSTEPDAGSTELDAGSTELDAGSTELDAGSTELDAGSTELDAGSTELDAGSTELDGGFPAEFPSPPQVMTAGGPVLLSAVIVPIFFADDDQTIVPGLKDFYSKIGASQYWSALSEYGVGPATSATPVVLTSDAPATVNETQAAGSDTWTELQNAINSGAAPMPTADTIYVIHYPATTTVSLNGTPSCTGFASYHSEMDVGEFAIPYAVIPQCSQTGMTDLQVATTAASHELVESATDPNPLTAPAYAAEDYAHFYWFTASNGGEIADMCVNDPESVYQSTDLTYMVQRFWSNDDAVAGHDPCAPALPGEVYFNTVPVMSDTINYSAAGVVVPVTGVAITPGQTVTIPLDLYSDAATSGPWSVGVLDYNAAIGGTANLSFSLSGTTGQNGQQLFFSITPQSASPTGSDLFIVVSTLGTGSSEVTHLWYGIVGD